jgi:hypothetical protein
VGPPGLQGIRDSKTRTPLERSAEHADRAFFTPRRGDNGQNPIFESTCHEGNYALTSILAGARVLEGTR